MAIRSLKESFETIGVWYLPDGPQTAIPGSLQYRPERTELHLNGSFDLSMRVLLGEGDLKYYSTIYGTTREGEKVTLRDAYQGGLTINQRPSLSGGSMQERIISSWLFIGEHVPPDAVFPSVGFRIPGLQIWLSQQTIETASERHNETGQFDSIYRVRSLPQETTRVAGLETNIHWGWSSTSKHKNHTSISVEISGWVVIQPDTPKTIDWYLEQQNKLTTMLAFLAGSAMSPDCINAFVDKPVREVSVMPTLSDAKCCPYEHILEFYMPRDKMGIDLNIVVMNWFDVYPKASSPIQLAMSVLVSKDLWLHVKFLSLMQALEGFHRVFFGGNYMPEEKYESVRKAMSDAIPPELASDHKEALKSRIRYGNQISLRKRLDVLAGILSEPIRRMILGGKGKVPNQWSETRNYYTHWDEELRPKILDLGGMNTANVRLEHFLRALYLDKMGIPQESILKSLQDHSEMARYLVQLNASEATK